MLQRNQSIVHQATLKNENSINNNYGDILSDNGFTNEHTSSDDPNKTASDNKISVNNEDHHLSDSIISVENVNIKSCNNLKAFKIKRMF